jgi:hypothetical protein
MPKTIVAIGLTGILVVLGLAPASEAQAAGIGASLAARDGLASPLVETVKGRGHAFGHRRHVNRGLHRGFSIGKGNPHRR